MSDTKNSTDEAGAPLVSVIIPVYNGAAYIAEAVTSVLQQDYPALEIIVVDDGSSDDTRYIVLSFGPKVTLLTQTNAGAAAARNRGIRFARGKYIAFLDADDVWWRNKISLQMDALRHSGYKMAYTGFILWHPDKDGKYVCDDSIFERPMHPARNVCKIVSGWIYADLLTDCLVWTSTVIVEKSELEKVGLFDESLQKGQDYDLWLKLSRRIEMLGLEKPTAMYRIHAGSTTASIKNINYEYLILTRTVKRWGETGPDGRSPPRGFVATRLARSNFGYGYAHLKAGDPHIAILAFRDSLKCPQFRFRAFLLFLVAGLKSLVQLGRHKARDGTRKTTH